jgi:hypothetical protein
MYTHVCICKKIIPVETVPGIMGCHLWETSGPG